MVECTICGMSIHGFADSDVTCPECEQANFHGDPLRHPPRAQRHPLPWWQRERLPLAPRRDGLRALTFIQGPWTWSPEDGVQGSTDV